MQTSIAAGARPCGSSNSFANGANQNAGNMISDRPSTRLHFGPGGATSICLGEDTDSFVRGPAKVGQPPVSSNSFATGANPNAGNLISDRPSTRLRHAPGGASSICLGQDADVVGSHGANGVSSNRFASGANQNAGNVISDRPTTRIHQGPGGNTSIVLGEDVGALQRSTPVASSRPTVGANQHAGSAPTAQAHCSPNGSSSLCLGEEPRQSGASVVGMQPVSSNRFANGTNQNTGNVLTDRPSTRLHHAPGGASSICLGEDTPTTEAARRPLRSDLQSAASVHKPSRADELPSSPATPQAASTPQAHSRKSIDPGEGECLSAPKVSSNRFASGASQNTGNVITDRPTTRLHYGPGGASSICLGTDSGSMFATVAEKQGKSCTKAGVELQKANENKNLSNLEANPRGVRQAPGGASQLVLG